MATLEILDEAPKPKRSPSSKKVPVPKFEIEEPACPHGYTREQVDRLLGSEDAEAAFRKWMRGQTMMACEGFEWDEKKEKYVDNDCKGKNHGGIVYTDDFQRYMKGHRRIYD